LGTNLGLFCVLGVRRANYVSCEGHWMPLPLHTFARTGFRSSRQRGDGKPYKPTEISAAIGDFILYQCQHLHLAIRYVIMPKLLLVSYILVLLYITIKQRQRATGKYKVLLAQRLF
jgi:hypothetical protein